MKKIYLVFVCAAVLPMMLNCGGSSSGSKSPRYAGTNNEIIAFSFTTAKNNALGIKTDAIGQIKDNSIKLEVPYGTNVKALIAEFVANSNGIEVNGVNQQSGITVNDFTNPVIYNLSADDGTKHNYTVTVTKAPGTEKKIVSYSINGVPGIIDDNAGTISVVLPPRSDVTALKAVFTVIGKSITVTDTEQFTGVTQNDFSNPVVYTVNAYDDTSRMYTVTVIVEKAPWNEITYFGFRKADNPSLDTDITGIFSDTDIQIVLPFGSNPADLVAYYVTEGKSVTIDGDIQESGVTHNDFTDSKIYHVTAENGSVKDYNVTVSVAKSDAKAITSFSLDGETGTIDEQSHAINIQFSSSKNLSNLIATFATTGVSVKIDNVVQISGATVNDYSNPVIYTVAADNGTTRDYTITAVNSEEITGLWNFEYGTDGSYTVQGTTEVPGVTGNALQFDGLSDYIYITDSDALTLANGGTIEVVLNAITHRPYAGIVHKGVLNDFSDETYSFQFWGVNGTDGTLRFLVHNTTQDADNFTFVDSSTKLNTGTWYHLIVTWDTSHLALYINGNKDASIETDVGEVKDSDGGLVIGAQMNHVFDGYTPWGDLGFNGIIDSVKILNRPLSDSEAAANYQNFVDTAGTGFTAYLLSVAKHNIPYIVVVLAFIVIVLAGLYTYNRKRAGAAS